MPPHAIAQLPQSAQFPRATDLAQHHHAHQQCHAPNVSDHQRLDRAAPRRLPRMIEPDQQERGHRRQFPEDEQHQHAIGQHQPQHGPHERQQERQEPP
jgi:hypothetical protein